MERVASKASIRVGLMPPLTGLVGIYGSEIARAGRIACDEVNEAGGVLGKPLELIIEDDGSFPESAVAAAEKLVREHRCAGIIGNLLSNSRIAVAYRVAEPSRTPYLNFSFYEGSILSRYFFHFAALPNQQIDRMIPFMREKFGPRMFFAGNNYEWPRGSVDAAKRILLRSGGEVVGEEYLPIGADESMLERLLDRVGQARPDVFVPYFAGVDQVNLLTQFTERGLKSHMAVVMGHYDELMASKLPPAVREGFYSSNTYFMTLDTPENGRYLKRLAELPGVTGIWPDGNGILTNFGEGTYACVKAFAKAVNMAGSTDPDALIDVLNTIQVAGPQGRLKMDPVTHHATVNTYLSRCNAQGVFEIVEKFGAIAPVMPDRYSHQRISQRATLEDDIRLQARMLEQMTEAVLLVHSATEDIIYANGGAERMFGYGKGELTGMQVASIMDTSSANRNGTDLIHQIVSILNATGTWRGDTHHLRKDGTFLWCSSSASTFTHPFHGEVWMVVFQNISALKESQDQLLRSEDRLRRVIKATNDGIWDWNVLTHEEYLSPRWKEILGYREEELENFNSTFINLVHPDDRECTAVAVQRHFEQNDPYHVEIRMQHKDGAYRWILVRGEAVRSESGKPVRMVGSISDITEAKAASERLKASLRQKEVLLKEVYHRVKNNLQVVSGLLNMQTFGAGEEARGLLAESANRVRSMALVHELLYQSGDLSRISVKAYVRHLLDNLRASYSGTAQQVQVRLEIEDILLGIETAVPLGLIINELVSNSYKHAYPDGRKGEILLRLGIRDDKSVAVEVSDDGVGLLPDFDPVRQTTLGMRLVVSLVDQLEGKFCFGPGGGGGTSFSMHFMSEEPEAKRLEGVQ